MATVNVFGKAVTEGNRMERTLEALDNPNADGKRDQALAYVRQVKQNWGNGVSTLGIFYNATGETLHFIRENSFFGKIEGSYPMRVQNGQWGAFFHGKSPVMPSGSVGFVVYRVRVNDTEFCNQLIAWSTPWDQLSHINQAYCDIFDDGNIDAPAEVYRKMDYNDKPEHFVIKKGMRVATKIEEGTSPVYEAEFGRTDFAFR